MSDNPGLTDLSVKDLRQLAAEHDIQNRSRLGKEDLISALQDVLSTRADQLGGEAGAPPPAADPVPAAAQPVASEPEILTPESVAEFASPAPAAAPADPQDGGPAPGEEPGDGGGEGERRRRRRRRRRGRRGRAGEEQGPDDGSAEGGDEGDGAGEEDDEDEAGTDEDRPPPEARDGQRDPGRDRDGQRDPGRDRQGRQERGPQPDGIPRPRLNGPQRPLPNALDRLRSIAAGIVDLCDPGTPGWAQPRLAELLAEIGVVPTPSQGVPHPDFHEVVGAVRSPAIAPGHIAEIAAVGYSIRGDRGDLFPLVKARVRISGEADRRSAPVEPSRPTPPPPPPPPAPEPAPPPRDEAPERAATPEPSPEGSEPIPEAQVRAIRPPAPSPGRHAERPHPREAPGEAPRLPLAMQVADELAQRPKAEDFRRLGLNEQILADLAEMGWQKPTPIQAAAIPVVLTGCDLLGQAQTGTGKTGAFALPIMQKLYSLEGEGPVALVLCPTRELARQVHGEFLRMAGKSGARATVIYGGVPMDDQFRALERHPHVVIGTPGRIIDHMRRRTLDLSRLAVAVLDEADQMLDIGFWPDVNYIIGHTPPTRQILLFSATFPDEVKQLAEKHMKSPERVHVAPEQVTVAEVDQKYIAVPRERKNDLLARFIEQFNPPQMLVFCKTKHQTDRVAEVLKRKRMSAAAIHGDLPQSKRERTLADFRSGELQCLIATNVAARGLDIPSVSHVVNYDVPEMPEEYVHRIGRTARNGARGVARTFITRDDGQFLIEIEKHIGLLLEEERVPGFEAPLPAPEELGPGPAPEAPRLLKPLVGGIRLGRRRR